MANYSFDDLEKAVTGLGELINESVGSSVDDISKAIAEVASYLNDNGIYSIGYYRGKKTYLCSWTAYKAARRGNEDAYFEILDKQYDGRVVILYHDKITYLEKDGEWEYVGDYEFSIKKGQVVGEKSGSKDNEPLTQEDMKWFIYL